MFHTFTFCCLCCCCLLGVFGVELKSVKEGDSVTLQTNVPEIQTDDLITWMFGNDSTQIARTDGVKSEILDGRFRDRLKLDEKTGSLTITNIRAEHAGVYEVEISRSSSSDSTHTFSVTVHGVFGVELKSVMDGDSVTLQTNVTEIQRDDLITWMFGTDRSLIARTDGVKSEILDGRFRDRLKLDEKTGSLTITNIRAEQAGAYEVEISSSSASTHRFNVTVYESTFCCHVYEVVTRLVLSALVGVAAVVIVVYDITSRRAEQKRTSSSSSDPNR